MSTSHQCASTSAIIIINIITIIIQLLWNHLPSQIHVAQILSGSSSSSAPLLKCFLFQGPTTWGTPLISPYCKWRLIHSFIHSGYIYSASLSPLLCRGTPDYSIDTVSTVSEGLAQGPYVLIEVPKVLIEVSI